jgi:hypothetical protein
MAHILKLEQTMKYIGSILAMLGGLIVVLAALVSLVSKEVRGIWTYEFSSTQEFFVVAAILAIMITILAFLSFSTKPKLLGSIIIFASFAGIIVGSTLTDIAMIFSILGGLALYTMPKQEKEADMEEPSSLKPGQPDEPATPNPS